MFQTDEPDDAGGGEDGAQDEISAIDEGVLQTHVEDLRVFGESHVRLRASSAARRMAATMLSGRAIPLPAMSNAVP